MITQTLGRFGLLACLLLAGCSEDWGPDQHGEAITAQQLDGRWLVINYWAQWCGPCRTEVPELNTLDRSLDDVTVLGVNFDGIEGDELVAAADELGITFRVLAVDPAERLSLPPSAVLPVTYILDPDREVRARLVGEQTAEGLRARLAGLRAATD